MEKDYLTYLQSVAFRDTSYFDHIRHDIIKYACNPGIKTVLSVGCAQGGTEKILIDRYGKTVYGIELNKKAAEVAAKNGVCIIGDDANKIDPSKIKLVFDCIIFADILEHLYDPLDILKRCTTLLREGGIVCISIPNFRHYSVLYSLFIRGLIHYRDAGILDRTHLRITTRKMAIEWLETCGLRLQVVGYIFQGRRYKLLSLLFFKRFDDFIAQQILVIGRKESH
jgi:2-polyprenyl-3-methyl-5-hydroxy-6-metoxy-1,4-benzoquinol methylase